MGFERSEMVMYRTEDGATKIDVRLEDATVWLSQAQMATLFQVTKQNISLHIRNIFQEGELEPSTVVKEYLTTAEDGKNYRTQFYNLDAIIAVGYRVRSPRGTQFRIWATERLREYVVKGFAMNDDLLKKAGGGGYWKELLERIRDIRSSEKVFYRQLLDLYATSVDYDPKSPQSITFFKVVQNKMHYAAHGQTAPETIAARADANKPFMGLTSFEGDRLAKKDIGIAKNYLTQQELAVLNRLVSAYFDLAELKAMSHQPMHMQDWLSELDAFAAQYGQGVLNGPGTVSHEAALQKAQQEYEQYRLATSDIPTRAEQDYLDSLMVVQKKLKGNGK
ncbi:MAG: virulence RhuM family protein [Candidatus Limiplasma sp.]|nr:virulence RhuM family protein [Candidatus Limiplasma sp.]